MRIKRGTVKNRKHNAILKRAKGYRLSYSKLYRRATEALLHAGKYSFAHRKRRKSDKRREWIKAISAGLYGTGLSYSQFIGGLRKNSIELDRKVLAHLAQANPEHFAEVVKQVS
jgi:large subunit ribosomal protein L20